MMSSDYPSVASTPTSNGPTQRREFQAWTGPFDPAPRICDLGIDSTTCMYGVYAVPAPQGGFVLIETGPSSGLPRLHHWLREQGMPLQDLRAIFLTHVHLDHAGACGTLLRQHEVPVYCHPQAVDHLVDPSRLKVGSDSLFRANVDQMWGDVEAVAPKLLHGMADGESITVGGLHLRAWHTPGHASNHVVWQWLNAPASQRNGGKCSVFAGDVAGICLPGAPYIWPPTPSPDFDLDGWLYSLDRLRQLQAGRLYLSHFGAVDEVTSHLDQLQARLLRWVELAERVMAECSSSGRVAAELKLLDDGEVAAAGVPPEVFATFDRNNPHRLNAAGLVRYLVQREAQLTRRAG